MCASFPWLTSRMLLVTVHLSPLSQAVLSRCLLKLMLCLSAWSWWRAEAVCSLSSSSGVLACIVCLFSSVRYECVLPQPLPARRTGILVVPSSRRLVDEFCLLFSSCNDGGDPEPARRPRLSRDSNRERMAKVDSHHTSFRRPRMCVCVTVCAVCLRH